MPPSGISFALAGSVLAAGLAFAPAPARALGTLHTFQFGTSPDASSPSAFFSSTPEAGSTSAPINLTFNNARVSRNRVKDVSVTSEGVCLYKVGGRNSCGPNANGRGRQSSIDISFDKNVQLISYQYGLLSLGNRSANPTLVWTNQVDPSLESNEGLSGKSAGTSYDFATQFTLKAFQTITIAGFGGGGGGPATQVRLGQLIVQEAPQSPSNVPGPLPLLGAGAAFAWSRRLRSRVTSAQLN